MAEYSRVQVRSLIFHLLYMMEENDYEVSLSSLIDLVNRGYEQEIPLDGEIAQAAQFIIDHRLQLDTITQTFLEHWKLDRLGVCTRLILRLGTWELLKTDTHSSIVINEAIELSKDFAEKDAYKFVNGILDKIAAQREELKSRLA